MLLIALKNWSKSQTFVIFYNTLVLSFHISC